MLKKSLLAFILLLSNYPVRAQIDSTTVVQLLNQVATQNISSDIANLADANGAKTRVSYTDGNRWAVDYIKQRFESMPGLTCVQLDTFVLDFATPPFNLVRLFNVVATLEGAGQPDQYFIVGGHLDATANLDPNLTWESDWATANAQGADDNASGVAAILEIARVLSDPANGFSSNYSIKFIAFGAEERHPAYQNENHQGARHFVQGAFNRGDQILGAYIVDMIGYNSTGNHHFNIVSNGKSDELALKLLEVNQRFDIGLHVNTSFKEVTYSDHDQFWLYRYKANLLIENAPPWNDNLPWYMENPFYHRESDVPAAINLQQVTKIAKLTLAAVASLSTLLTSVETSTGDTQPLSFTLLQNYPNPFNAGTRILYQLLFSGQVKLTVYDVRGQEVRSLVGQRQQPGEYAVTWDGADAAGRPVPSALYFYRLTVDDRTFVRKMVYAK